MKKGLKLWKDNLHLIEEYKDLYDFFEIYIDPDFPLEELKKYSTYNITIHAAHNRHDFNPSDKDKHKLCKKILDLALKAAEIVNSPWIIAHVGPDHDKNSKKNMLEFFDDNWNEKVIFENCTLVDYTNNDTKYLFSLPEEMKELLSRYNAKMVLDFGHAICSANILKKNPEKLIDEFLELKPICFHVSGIEMNSVSDTHLNLFAVDSKMEYLKKIKADKFVTFEVDYQTNKNRNAQIKNIKFFESCL